MRVAVSLAMLTLISGCAVTPERFYRSKSDLSVAALCRTYQKAHANAGLADDVSAELRSRGKNASDCAEVIAAQNAKNANVALIAISVAAFIAAGASASNFELPPGT
jgi:2-succinyl-5-enolpyruvyl-6-hydroxy-3-cyclohexene-1-carboxylate synthase